MKYLIFLIFVFCLFLFLIFSNSMHYCWIGAFLKDNPTEDDIRSFRQEFGKKPYLVMIFIDWPRFVSEQTITSVYRKNSVLFITWEPWDASSKKGVPFEKIIAGEYDNYIKFFSSRIKDIKKPIFIRFAHEVNGDWYPWSGLNIESDKYVSAYRHIVDIFKKVKARNVFWVFSINWENVPRGNSFVNYYPGGKYVDYIGIDGYNWGNTQPWSRWMSFRDIFEPAIHESWRLFRKPIIISEFSTCSSGGDKGEWIREALGYIRKERRIKGFVLFNMDKEADWGFSGRSRYSQELKRQLADKHFVEKN